MQYEHPTPEMLRTAIRSFGDDPQRISDKQMSQICSRLIVVPDPHEYDMRNYHRIDACP